MGNLVSLAKTAKVSLEKKGIFNEQMNVVLALDVSASMRSLYQNGTVQETVERLLGLGMNLDSNKSIEVYLFGVKNHYAGEAQEQNIQGFVDREIVKRYPLEMGTNYAGVINQIGKDFVGYNPAGTPAEKPSKMFGGLFKKKEEPAAPVGLSKPSTQGTVVYFITDGNNSDKDATRRAITELSKESIFWQFIGIGRERFNFLEELDDMQGRFVDNADFFKITDISKISDEELYDKLLTELPSWIDTVRQKGLIQ